MSFFDEIFKGIKQQKFSPNLANEQNQMDPTQDIINLAKSKENVKSPSIFANVLSGVGDTLLSPKIPGQSFLESLAQGVGRGADLYSQQYQENEQKKLEAIKLKKLAMDTIMNTERYKQDRKKSELGMDISKQKLEDLKGKQFSKQNEFLEKQKQAELNKLKNIKNTGQRIDKALTMFDEFLTEAGGNGWKFWEDSFKSPVFKGLNNFLPKQYQIKENFTPETAKAWYKNMKTISDFSKDPSSTIHQISKQYDISPEEAKDVYFERLQELGAEF